MNDSEDPTYLSRRRVMLGGLGVAAGAVLAACGRNGGGPSGPSAQPGATTTAPGAATPTAGGESGPLALTPECRDDDDVTPAQTEGPFFTARSPERTNLRGRASGTKLLLTGTVVTPDCRPVAGALVDFWQADAAGIYDNAGFTFRGHQFTDAQGRYQLESVVPGPYPGRTPHLHVKVQPAGGRVLTTQLYFPGEAGNASDGFHSRELEVAQTDGADGRSATFQFVVKT